MSRAYIAVEFRPGQRRYTYHHDSDEVLVAGDVVKVAARGDPGAWQRAIVVGAADEPKFPTKPILGIVETAAARAARKEGTVIE